MATSKPFVSPSFSYETLEAINIKNPKRNPDKEVVSREEYVLNKDSRIPSVKIAPSYDISTKSTLSYEAPKHDVIRDEIPQYGEKRKLNTIDNEEQEQIPHKRLKFNPPKFVFNSIDSRFTLKSPKNMIKFVTLSDKLNYMLGYEPKQKIYSNAQAKYIPDIRGGIHRFCIYENSGLTEPIIFGDKMTSLLRIVNVDTVPGKNGTVDYNFPIYKRVLAKEISDIEIEVKTMKNKYVPFNYGEFIVTLIFKKVF